METPSSGHPLIDGVLWIWFALTALAVAYVAYDQFKGGPEQKENSLAMKTMRWGWVLLTLYTGVFALVIYWFLHRASARKTPEPPLWEQTVESTIHCVAGDATGILLAAAVTSWLRLPMSLEVMVEYVAGFAVGLFLFQALCMKSTFDGSYRRAVGGTLLAENRDFMRTNMYLVLYPGLAIVLSALSLNMLGDGLRDALDPRLKN